MTWRLDFILSYQSIFGLVNDTEEYTRCFLYDPILFRIAIPKVLVTQASRSGRFGGVRSSITAKVAPSPFQF